MTRSLLVYLTSPSKWVAATTLLPFLPTMSLTISSTLSPFPYAAAALTAYTKQAELIFDDAATDVALDLSGTVISGEEKIVEELAKVGGLPSDSTTV